MNALLEINNLKHAFEKKKFVLKDINLEIYSGEIISILGPSGSGTQDFLGLGHWLSGLFSYEFLEARNNNSWSDYLGAVLGMGFAVAGTGTNVGHELTHRIRDKIAMLEGRWLLSTSCNPDFAIEHVYGHHVTVGTDEDPATAKKGENVYMFSLRSTIFGHTSALNLIYLYLLIIV